MNIIIVFIGGVLGGSARLGLNDSLPKTGAFPLTTLLINLAGVFVFALLIKRWRPVKNTNEKFILAVGTGFLGAFTTFSSAMLDMIDLASAGHYVLLFIYVMLEVGGGLLLALLGVSAARRWVGR